MTLAGDCYLFQWFFTALSVRPGSSLAISAQRLPYCEPFGEGERGGVGDWVGDWVGKVE